MKWTPPSKRGVDPPVVTTSKPKFSLPTSITANTYFYSLYGGSSFPSYPVLFKQSSHALTWALSRYVRDGIVLRDGETPHWIQYVGVIYNIHDTNIKRITLPSRAKPSQIEKQFYARVGFYEPVDQSLISSLPSYLRCKDHLYQSCRLQVNALADYHLSATSTYRRKAVCLAYSADDLECIHSGFLNNKKTELSPYIQLESKFKYLYSSEYLSYSESI